MGACAPDGDHDIIAVVTLETVRCLLVFELILVRIKRFSFRLQVVRAGAAVEVIGCRGCTGGSDQDVVAAVAVFMSVRAAPGEQVIGARASLQGDITEAVRARGVDPIRAKKSVVAAKPPK